MIRELFEYGRRASPDIGLRAYVASGLLFPGA
jgi:hypothetical protein